MCNAAFRSVQVHSDTLHPDFIVRILDLDDDSDLFRVVHNHDVIIAVARFLIGPDNPVAVESGGTFEQQCCRKLQATTRLDGGINANMVVIDEAYKFLHYL